MRPIERPNIEWVARLNPSGAAGCGLEALPGLTALDRAALWKAGITSLAELRAVLARGEDLTALPGIGKARAEKVQAAFESLPDQVLLSPAAVSQLVEGACLRFAKTLRAVANDGHEHDWCVVSPYLEYQGNVYARIRWRLANHAALSLFVSWLRTGAKDAGPADGRFHVLRAAGVVIQECADDEPPF